MTINNEPLEEVLSNYDFQVLSIKNESYKEKKGVWWIQTSDGLKVLKKISNSENTFKYILSAIRHLSHNGVNIPTVNRTKEGKEYALINDVCYVLSEAVEGNTPNFSNKNELEKAVKGLALFHKASVGFFPIEDTKPKKHLGTWIEDYTSQIEDMNNFYKDELKANGSEIGQFIINQFPQFYERSNKIIEELKGQEYRDWTLKTEKIGGLCHQDYAAGNLLLDRAGKLFVLDTDSITIDIPARDIRKFINKIMKKQAKPDLELAKKIFAYYQSVNPLTPSEWKVVKLDLTFPHLFIGAMNKYYYKRDKEWGIESYFKRIKESCAAEKAKMELIEDFEGIISR